jgi:signal peptidase I
VSEARQILRKKSYRIPEAVTAEVEAAIGQVTAAVESPDPERLTSAISDLDGKLDHHLGFARKSTTREYAESILVAVAIALLLRTFVVEAFQIPSGSMIPTLEIGDHIFVSKFSYGLGIPFTNKKIFQWSDPERGDVIVFKFPLSTEVDYIKRVVALPGEQVEVRRNEIFINGKPMPREHLNEPCTDSQRELLALDGVPERDCDIWRETLSGKSHKTRHDIDREPTDFGPKVVPEDSVFVMGDNRDNSNDSRVWGTVQRDLIKGRALIVWWSRGPTEGEWSLKSLRDWFGAIRWRRFFHPVD